MTTRYVLLAVMAASILLPDLLAAQIRRKGASRSSASSDYEWEMEEKPERSERRSRRERRREKEEDERDSDRDREKSRDRDKDGERGKEETEARPMTSKAEIEGYLQKRIKDLSAFHKGQMTFGKRMDAAWTKFWDEIYADRKLFDIRLARQRLNMFESLASLHPSAHEATIEDFERLQATQIGAFEASLKKRMDDFLSRIAGDLQSFTKDQEKKREEFNRELIEAWSGTKDRKVRRSKRRAKEDRRED